MKIGEIAQQAKHMLYMQKALILPAVTQCLLKKKLEVGNGDKKPGEE